VCLIRSLATAATGTPAGMRGGEKESTREDVGGRGQEGVPAGLKRGGERERSTCFHAYVAIIPRQREFIGNNTI
jgi:hypothetical protein